MKTGVIGAGSWGTALAKLLAEKGIDVTLWVFEPDLCKEMKKTRENKYYLSGCSLPDGLRFTNSLEEAAEGKEIIVSVTPSHVVRQTVKKAVSHFKKGCIVVTASKGIENETLMTMSRVIEEEIPRSLNARIVALSGPSFAKDVANYLPTAVAVASGGDAESRKIQNIFSAPYFRTYTNKDILGVELGGALKNVIAIAAGISDGLGLGYSTRAALITRGLAEITRLGIKLGADPTTFMGLSGMGDLVLTCTGDLSRNRTVGIRLGRGEKLSEILSSMRMIAEGVKTTKSAYELSLRHGVEMPITEEVYKILYKNKEPKRGVGSLMKRELKSEMEGIV